MRISEIKSKISSILRGALCGINERYRTKDGYIKWGLVEDDIHAVIDTAFQPTSGADRDTSASELLAEIRETARKYKAVLRSDSPGRSL